MNHSPFKNRSPKLYVTIIGIILVGGFLFFGGAKDVNADGTCHYRKKTGEYVNVPAKDRADCQSIINADTNAASMYSAGVFNYYFDSLTPDKLENITPTDFSKVHTSASSSNSGQVKGTNDSCTGKYSIINPLGWIHCLLLGVLTFFGWLLSVAVAIFGWATDAQKLHDVLTSQFIYGGWTTVRDFLNIAFILVLLYTAFTIIFQVDKSNKKIILTIVLMALLVNFSFPITRFIIDVGNSMMYTIFNALDIKTNTIFSNIADESALGKIVDGSATDGTVAQLIAAIIFVAILSITFLMMAILFVIRIVALAIIIIFSPIAFVGTIVPAISSKVDWWGNLFKYTFFGPAMAFMIYISTKIMTGIDSVTGSTGYYENLQGSIGNNAGLITSMSKALIPVTILWIGMGIAQKMGIAGADMAKKWSTKAFKAVSLAPVKAGWWGMKKYGAVGGMQQKWQNFKKTGFLGSDRTEERAAKIAGSGPFKVKGAYEELERKKIAEERKKWKDQGGANDKIIEEALDSGDKIKMKAAAMEAAEKVGFGDKDHAYDNYQKAKNAVADSPAMKALFNDKVKEKHIKLVIEDEWKIGGKTAEKAYNDNLSGLTPDELAKQKGLHENIDTDTNLQNYIQKEIIDTGDVEYHKEFFKKLSRKQRAAYMEKNLNPERTTSKATTSSEPKKSYEETQKEFAKKNEEKMKDYFKPGEYS